MHYKKDGSLDMRYSSSRAAVASNSGSYSRSGSGAPSQTASRPQNVFSFPSAPSASSAGLHYKKDGTLDMRYSSSQNAARASVAPAPSFRPPVAAAPAPAGTLHYKKDGTLDMRYSSSQAATGVATSAAHASTPARPTTGQPASSSQLHFKKDGSLDMRYASSKAIAASSVSGRPSTDGLHYKKDGTLDMRYTSSKTVELQRRMESMQVAGDAGGGASSGAGGVDDHQSAREAYYRNLAEQNEEYRRLVQELSQRPVACEPTEVLPSSKDVAAYLKEYGLSTAEPATTPSSTTGLSQAPNTVSEGEEARMRSVTSALPSSICQLAKSELETAIAGHEELGKGAFGMVYKGRWRAQDVAVKVLYVSQLQRNEKGAFEKELIILGHLGTHVNLVQLVGYCTETPAFVMELVALGSLHHNLYYNNDETVTATLSTSGTKKKLLVGILSGLIQLHHVGIVHGDLKPHNVLLTQDFVAKITDFGLSRLRAKASSLTGMNTINTLSVTNQTLTQP